MQVADSRRKSLVVGRAVENQCKVHITFYVSSREKEESLVFNVTKEKENKANILNCTSFDTHIIIMQDFIATPLKVVKDDWES